MLLQTPHSFVKGRGCCRDGAGEVAGRLAPQRPPAVAHHPLAAAAQFLQISTRRRRSPLQPACRIPTVPHGGATDKVAYLLQSCGLPRGACRRSVWPLQFHVRLLAVVTEEDSDDVWHCGRVDRLLFQAQVRRDVHAQLLPRRVITSVRRAHRRHGCLASKVQVCRSRGSCTRIGSDGAPAGTERRERENARECSR